MRAIIDAVYIGIIVICLTIRRGNLAAHSRDDRTIRSGNKADAPAVSRLWRGAATASTSGLFNDEEKSKINALSKPWRASVKINS